MDGTPGSGESIEERLAAVERAVAEGEDCEGAGVAGEATARVDSLEADVADLTDRVAELEAATQALRGYVGNVRAVNEEVRERADAALATAEAAREAVDGPEARSEPPTSGAAPDHGPTKSRNGEPDGGCRCRRERSGQPTGQNREPRPTSDTGEDRSPSLAGRLRDLL